MELHLKLFYAIFVTLLIGILIVLSLVFLQDYLFYMWLAIAILVLLDISFLVWLFRQD